jgi:nuclear pore complex protein Nup98-Nup96
LSNKKRDNPKHLDLSILSNAVQENGRSARLATNTRIDTSNQTSTPLPASYELVPPRNLNFDITTSPQPRSNAKSDDSRLDVSLNESSQPSPFGRDVTQDSVVHQTTIQHGPVGITLSKRDIYTEPPIDELENFVQGGKVHLIDGFVVGRVGYGRIEWTGPISFSDVDLGDLVRFQRKQIVVYPDELKKPPIGQELNRKAIIALESIFPYNKETKEEIRVSLHYNLFKYISNVSKFRTHYLPKHKHSVVFLNANVSRWIAIFWNMRLKKEFGCSV